MRIQARKRTRGYGKQIGTGKRRTKNKNGKKTERTMTSNEEIRKTGRTWNARFATLSSTTRTSVAASPIRSRIRTVPRAICCVNTACESFRFDQVNETRSSQLHLSQIATAALINPSSLRRFALVHVLDPLSSIKVP